MLENAALVAYSIYFILQNVLVKRRYWLIGIGGAVLKSVLERSAHKDVKSGRYGKKMRFSCLNVRLLLPVLE